MLVLARDGDRFSDDADDGIRYRLPSGLEPLPAPDGGHQVALSRSPDGGLLHLRLTPTWPELAAGERRVPFASGRFRLLLRTPTATGGSAEARDSRDRGQWHPTAATTAAVVNRSLSLDPVEVAIAQRLGAGGNEVVEVEVELEVRGFAPTFPWRARVQTAALRSQLGALLGSSPASWTDVQDAFLGLETGAFSWHPLAPAALPPPDDEALLALALHSSPFLFDATDGGWVLRDAAPERLELSLAVPRLDARMIGLRWSFSAFLAAQADPSRYLTERRVPAPFEAGEALVVNDLPLADAGVRSVEVELRTGGPTGRVRHQFLPGQPGAARLRFVRETFEESDFSWQARAVVTTARGPVVVETDFRPTDLSIEINPDSIGLTPLRFAADTAIFDILEAVEIVVGSRTLTLTTTAPEAWAVGRTPPRAVAVTAVLADDRRESLGTLPIGAQGLLLEPSILGLGEVVTVRLRPPTDAAQRMAYLAVQAEGGPWRTLEPDAEIPWPVRRASRFEVPRLRYRARWVPRDTDGRTAPMIESAWRDGQGEQVTVEV